MQQQQQQPISMVDASPHSSSPATFRGGVKKFNRGGRKKSNKKGKPILIADEEKRKDDDHLANSRVGDLPEDTITTGTATASDPRTSISQNDLSPPSGISLEEKNRYSETKNRLNLRYDHNNSPPTWRSSSHRFSAQHSSTHFRSIQQQTHVPQYRHLTSRDPFHYYRRSGGHGNRGRPYRTSWRCNTQDYNPPHMPMYINRFPNFPQSLNTDDRASSWKFKPSISPSIDQSQFAAIDPVDLPTVSKDDADLVAKGDDQTVSDTETVITRYRHQHSIRSYGSIPKFESIDSNASLVQTSSSNGLQNAPPMLPLFEFQNDRFRGFKTTSSYNQSNGCPASSLTFTNRFRQWSHHETPIRLQHVSQLQSMPPAMTGIQSFPNSTQIAPSKSLCNEQETTGAEPPISLQTTRALSGVPQHLVSMFSSVLPSELYQSVFSQRYYE